MIETAQQYTARIVGFVGDEDPIGILSDTPTRLLSLTAGAPPEALRFTTSPERWTITQIAAHLVDAEIVGAWRFRSVLAQDGVTLQAYDQNAWARTFRYEEVPIAESVTLFGALRVATLNLLRRVDPSLRDRAGQHQERGRETVDHITRMYAGHDRNHLKQIERLLEEFDAQRG